jgi:uncharacterized protein
MSNQFENVAVVGASPKEERYSYKAMKMLLEHNHTAIPVSSLAKTILEQTGFKTLTDIPVPVHTVTMYVGPAGQSEVIEQIVQIKPKRVIFNPGTENPQAYDRLEQAGIAVQQACTLVLLTTNQF